jgi:hypothetical protein
MSQASGSDRVDHGLTGASRDYVDPAAEAAGTIRRILSNLAQIAQGAAELRNTYGTGHGRAGRTKGYLNTRRA